MYSKDAVQHPDLWIPHIYLQRHFMKRHGVAVALAFHLGSGRGPLALGTPRDCHLSRAVTY